MDELTASLSQTLENKQLDNLNGVFINAAQDYAEITIDAIINNPGLNQIPVVQTILAVPKIWHGISDFLLLKKIIKFLFQLQDIPFEERRRFLEQLEGQERERILSQLILILDKHDQYKKSEIQGRLFKALILGTLNHTEYFSLTYATSLVNVDNLDNLIKFYAVNEGDPTSLLPEELYNLIFLQLIRIDNSSIGLWGGGGPTYKKNDLGRKYVDIITSI